MAKCSQGREGRLEPTQIFSDPAKLGSGVDEWRQLAACLEGSSYFQTPDWTLSWWELVGGRPPTQLALWRGARGDLEGVVALQRSKEDLHPRLPVGIPVWTNLGSGAGAADHCGWPVLPHRVGEVRHWLGGRDRDATLLMRNLDRETGVRLVPQGARLVTRSPCPRLRIPSPDEEVGSRNLRKQLRRYRRKLGQRGVSFRWVPPGQIDHALLDELFTLHRRRFDRKEQSSSFNRSTMDFHRRLVSCSRLHSGAAAVVAERGREVIGILYGFLWQKVFAYYQTGWDPSWSQLSLGTVLVEQAIRLAGANGARIFDFLRGDDPYKYRFGATERVDETWLLPRGAAGGPLLVAKYWAKRRLQGAHIPTAGGREG